MRDLRLALALAPVLVAADGGANRLLKAGLRPEAVIGDLDSITAETAEWVGMAQLHRIAEQVTTDFDKALRSVQAPFVLALGFAEGRVDHELAVLSSLVQRSVDAPPCLIVSRQDVIFHAPPRLELSLPVGARLSLFPMAAVSGESTGLEWPIAGLGFAPDGLIGTSNRVVGRQISLRFSNNGMLVILPRRHLRAALAALVRA